MVEKTLKTWLPESGVKVSKRINISAVIESGDRVMIVKLRTRKQEIKKLREHIASFRQTVINYH